MKSDVTVNIVILVIIIDKLLVMSVRCHSLSNEESVP